jgi:hypothetical protein
MNLAPAKILVRTADPKAHGLPELSGSHPMWAPAEAGHLRLGYSHGQKARERGLDQPLPCGTSPSTPELSQLSPEGLEAYMIK